MAKTCGFCGLIVNDSAETCEKCGYQFASDAAADVPIEKDPHPGVAVFKALMSVFALVMILVWWNRDSGPVVKAIEPPATRYSNASPAPARIETADACLSLKPDWKWSQTEYGGSVIEGVVQNSCAKSFSYAQITFKLYDKSKAQVGDAMTNIRGLDGYGRWRFKAHSIDSDTARTARFAEITAF